MAQPIVQGKPIDWSALYESTFAPCTKAYCADCGCVIIVSEDHDHIKYCYLCVRKRPQARTVVTKQTEQDLLCWKSCSKCGSHFIKSWTGPPLCLCLFRKPQY